MSDGSPEDTRIVNVDDLRTSISFKEWIGDLISRVVEKSVEAAWEKHLETCPFLKAKPQINGDHLRVESLVLSRAKFIGIIIGASIGSGTLSGFLARLL